MTQQPSPGTDLGAAIAQQYGVQRSAEWHTVQDEHLHKGLKDQGYCAVCLGTAQLQVHHIVPFHFVHLVYRGDLELDEMNLMTLCEVQGQDHHNLVGHLEDWEIYNPGGREIMAGAFKGLPVSQLTADEIKRSQQFQQWMSDKNIPKRWEKMGDDNRKALRKFLDATFPFIQAPDGPPAPYPFMEGGDDGKDPAKIATTYGTRLPVFKKQLQEMAAAAANAPAQSH